MSARQEEPNRARVDERIVELAGRQHGVVRRDQLLNAGIPAHRVAWRVRTRWLRSVHRGVYRAGPVITHHGGLMAAVLACGDEACISGETAAVEWQLAAVSSELLIDVIAPRGDHSARPGLRVHRAHPDVDEVTRLHGIPITTPARTLLDIAGRVTTRALEQAVAQCFDRQLATRDDLKALLTRHRRRPGVAWLRHVLDASTPPMLTRSEAEDRFLAFVGDAQLPRPEVNTRVAGFELDFYWRGSRLAVEIDGFAWHASRERFESDRRRYALLAAAGIRVMRVTWRQLQREPVAVMIRVSQALARPHG